MTDDVHLELANDLVANLIAAARRLGVNESHFAVALLSGAECVAERALAPDEWESALCAANKTYAVNTAFSKGS